MLICAMAAYYRAKGSSIKEELERIDVYKRQVRLLCWPCRRAVMYF